MPIIFLATDFGLEGPYTGQVKATLERQAPALPVIDLFADLPPFEPKLAAYLLAAYAQVLQPGDVMMAVVDPGVGSDRLPLMLRADDRWFVGPDNGLFEIIMRRANQVEVFAITWQPTVLSASFHGRDLFAPVAAKLASRQPVAHRPVTPIPCDGWPSDLAQVVYVDRYGNAMTGLRAVTMPDDVWLTVQGKPFGKARTFADNPAGTAFWYENANGLLEIAVNTGSAAARLGLAPGMPVSVDPSG